MASPPSREGTAPLVGRAGQAADILLQVCHTVCGNWEVEAVLRSATKVAAGAVNAEACSILLQERDADTGEPYLDAKAREEAGGPRGVRVPVDENSVAGWVAKHGQALLVPDVRQDGRFSSRHDAGGGLRTRSTICAPLRAKENRLGVVQIFNRRDGKPFDAQDLELSKAVAGLIARALGRAEEYQARIDAERLATVGRTIAEAAHFIKNVLNGLESGAYAIERNLQGEQSSAVADGWKTVKRNVQLLSKIVQDMLSYSKPRRPVRQPCSLGEVCRDVAGLLQEQAGKKSVKLACDPSGGPSEVWIDEAAIRRCLINLVGNAIDACAEEGSVHVETRPARARGHFAIVVRDDGCGMDPAAREKAFDPFYSTKGSEGTGLGLAVVRKVVEEHGGTIWIESSPGHGAEFTLILPLKPPKGNAELWRGFEHGRKIPDGKNSTGGKTQ